MWPGAEIKAGLGGGAAGVSVGSADGLRSLSIGPRRALMKEGWLEGRMRERSLDICPNTCLFDIVMKQR